MGKAQGIARADAFSTQSVWYFGWWGGGIPSGRSAGSRVVKWRLAWRGTGSYKSPADTHIKDLLAGKEESS